MDNILTAEKIKTYLKPRPRDCHKGDFGRLFILASSQNMSGACILCAKAAMRSGVGLCCVGSVESAILPLKAALAEALTLTLPQNKIGAISKKALPLILGELSSASAALIGCGLSVSNDTAKILAKLLPSLKIPTVLDADGINLLSRNITLLKNISAPIVLTPHLKEMSRLTGKSVEEIKKSKQACATEFSKKHGVYVVLKDFETVVSCPDGSISINLGGHPCMAKGGSGDMLSGMLASFLAQGYSPKVACELAVFLHSKAGEACGEKMGDFSVLTSDMIEMLPEVFKSI